MIKSGKSTLWTRTVLVMVLVLFASGTGPVVADPVEEEQAIVQLQNLNKDFTAIAKKATPTVVTISTRPVVERRSCAPASIARATCAPRASSPTCCSIPSPTSPEPQKEAPGRSGKRLPGAAHGLEGMAQKLMRKLMFSPW